MYRIGDKGIDFSFFRPPTPHDPARWGAKFVVRYSSEVNDHTRGKIISPAEFRGYLHAGLDVVANEEFFEGRIRQGAAAGAVDGRRASDQWHACGLAPGASIYVSDDTAPNPDFYNAIDEYLHAFEESLGGVYHADIYGGGPVIKEMKRRGRARYGWQAMAAAWSNYRTDWGAALLQNGKTWYGVQADEDEVRSPVFGSHLQALGKPSTASTAHPTGASRYDVRVAKHDTLASIAEANHVSVAAIKAANPQITDWASLHPGEVVHVPAHGPAGHRVTHTVLPGETMWGIAQAWHVSLTSLEHANPQIPNPALIHPGDIIFHP
jgi:LysM repeat protein